MDYGCCATGRRLAKLDNCYGWSTPVDGSPAARIAASYLVSDYTICRSELVSRSFDLQMVYGCCAAGRRLAKLDNCYGRCISADTSVGASLSRDLLIVA